MSRCYAVVMLACAWILWSEQEFMVIESGGVKSDPKEWITLGATESLKSCEAAMADMMRKQKHSDFFPKVNIRGNIVVSRMRDDKGMLTTRYICLPDTVDPRSRGKE